MDTGSVIVVLAALVVVLGFTLMMRGSRGAQMEPPESSDEEADSEGS